MLLLATTRAVERASLLFAVLTIIANVIALVGIVWWLWSRTSAERRTRFARATDRLAPWALWLAFAIAAVCMGGSLWFSEVANLPPCRLCWFQRTAMYPLAVLLLIAALRRDRRIAWYAIPIAVLGLGVSTYHYLVEWHPEWETSCDPLNPCSILWFGRRFGWITLPYMAGSGFVAVIVLAGLVWPRSTRPRAELDETGSDVGTLVSPTPERTAPR